MSLYRRELAATVLLVGRDPKWHLQRRSGECYSLVSYMKCETKTMRVWMLDWSWECCVSILLRTKWHGQIANGVLLVVLNNAWSIDVRGAAICWNFDWNGIQCRIYSRVVRSLRYFCKKKIFDRFEQVPSGFPLWVKHKCWLRELVVSCADITAGGTGPPAEEWWVNILFFR